MICVFEILGRTYPKYFLDTNDRIPVPFFPRVMSAGGFVFYAFFPSLLPSFFFLSEPFLNLLDPTQEEDKSDFPFPPITLG